MVVDLLRVDPAHVAQYPLGLVGVEGNVLDVGHLGVASVTEAPDDVAVHDRLRDHVGDVLDPVSSVHDVVGLNHRHRCHSAQAVTAGLDYVHFTDQPGGGNFTAECRFNFARSDCQAAGGTDQNPAPSFCGLRKLFLQRSEIRGRGDSGGAVDHHVCHHSYPPRISPAFLGSKLPK
jgi:hypothetical protein